MKTILAVALLLGTVTGASAQLYGQQQNTYGNGGLSGAGSNPNSHYVAPYTNSHGTYVAPHYQTNPNHTQTDNFGATGNYNPYTGTYGTHVPKY